MNLWNRFLGFGLSVFLFHIRTVSQIVIKAKYMLSTSHFFNKFLNCWIISEINNYKNQFNNSKKNLYKGLQFSESLFFATFGDHLEFHI